MASSVMVSSATAMSRATPAHSRWSQTQVQPAAFLATRKSYTDLSKLPSNGGRVQCMQVWPMEGKKEFKTLSYLPCK